MVSSSATTSETELSNPSMQSFVSKEDRENLSEVAFRTFDTISHDYEIYAKEMGRKQFFSQVYPHKAKLIAAYIIETFKKLGSDLTLLKEGSKISTVPNVPKYDKQLQQFLRTLQEQGLIIQKYDTWIRTARAFSVKPSAVERFKKIQTDFPQFSVEYELLYMVGSQLN